MLSNANFEVPAIESPGYCPELARSCMVVAAHLAHAESRATEFCPSVAAVVAGTNPKPVIYPCSARLQPYYVLPRSKNSNEEDMGCIRRIQELKGR